MTRDKGDGKGPTGESGGCPRLVRVRAEEMGTVLNTEVLLRLSGGLTMPLVGGFIRFSFWRLQKKKKETLFPSSRHPLCFLDSSYKHVGMSRVR